MNDHPTRATKTIDRKKVWWITISAAVLIIAVVWLVNTTNQELSPTEVAARWVDDNVDALGEEIAGYLTGQNPVLREIGGELLEDRIHAVIAWEYSLPREIPPEGTSLFEVTATASVVFDLELPMGSGHIDAGIPFVFQIDQPGQSVTSSKLDPLGARVNIDIPGIPGLPTGATDRVKKEVIELVSKVDKSAVVEVIQKEIISNPPTEVVPPLKPKVASAHSLPPTPLQAERSRLPDVDTEHAECIAAARESNDSDVDNIRLETIEQTDPATLTDAQRGNWREFFRQRASELTTVCITLWSEPITEENADLRNQDFRGDKDKSGCVLYVERHIREDGVDDRANWKATYELLMTPYLSLSIAERMILREQLDDVSYCDDFYPQLFTARWVPISR